MADSKNGRHFSFETAANTPLLLTFVFYYKDGFCKLPVKQFVIDIILEVLPEFASGRMCFPVVCPDLSVVL